VRGGYDAAARTIGIKWHPMPVRVPEDLPRAFEDARRQRVEALSFGPDTQFLRAHLAEISELAVRERVGGELIVAPRSRNKPRQCCWQSLLQRKPRSPVPVFSNMV
jgi:hypothetical protein